MKIIGAICLVAVIGWAHLADADVYRYTDQHGNVIYTDSLDGIPDDQRSAAKVPDGENLVPPGSKGPMASSGQPAPSGDATVDLKSEQAELEALKSTLKAEFKALADENTRLKEAQKSAVTPDQRKAFNREVVSFNTRFQAYKEKEAAYQSRLEEFNRRLKAATSTTDN